MRRVAISSLVLVATVVACSDDDAVDSTVAPTSDATATTSRATTAVSPTTGTPPIEPATTADDGTPATTPDTGPTPTSAVSLGGPFGVDGEWAVESPAEHGIDARTR